MEGNPMALSHPDFIQIPRPVLQSKDLQPSDKFLFGYIYWLTQLQLKKCIISNAELAKLSNLNVRSINNALQRLEKAGLIERETEGSGPSAKRVMRCLVHYSKVMRQTTHSDASNDVLSTPVTTPVRNKNNEKEKLLKVEFLKKLAFSIKQPQAKPLTSRLAKLNTRLQTWTEQDLLKAAANLAADDWMMGKNDRKARYATLDYLLRNDENVEKWIDKTPIKAKGIRKI